MKKIKTQELFNLDETIAKELFQSDEYPWEILSKIHDYIINLGNCLSLEKFDKIGNDVWIAKNATISSSAEINGPTIIDENAEIRHSAFIRGNAIIGKNAVVGNSTELKNCILFNNVQVPHFNYVGDSILGYKSHFGAGVITSNVRIDKLDIVIRNDENIIETKLKKMGAMVGDNVEIGCNSVLNPGTIIGKNTIVYPLKSIKGIIDDNVILDFGFSCSSCSFFSFISII